MRSGARVSPEDMDPRYKDSGKGHTTWNPMSVLNTALIGAHTTTNTYKDPRKTMGFWNPPGPYNENLLFMWSVGAPNHRGI